MNELNKSELMQLRVFPREKLEPEEASGLNEPERSFVVERDGFLFECKRLYSIRELSKMAGSDRETVAKWASYMRAIPGPNGAKLYTFSTIMAGYVEYQRDRR